MENQNKNQNNFILIISKYKWLIGLIILAFIIGISLRDQLIYLQGNIMSNIKVSDPFDGTVFPVEKIPDYTKLTKEERSKDYNELDPNIFINVPNYFNSLIDRDLITLSSSKEEDREILRAKITFTIPYLGSYSKMWKENVGSHPGVDIILPMNTPVLAVANGIVVTAREDSKTGAGKYIVLRHDNVPYINENGQEITTTLFSIYEHLNEINVSVGDSVKKGTVIGKSGNSGRSTTPHLHFQIDKKSAKYHPVFYSDANEVAKDTIHPILWVYKYNNTQVPVNIAMIESNKNVGNNTINTNVNNSNTTNNESTNNELINISIENKNNDKQDTSTSTLLPNTNNENAKQENLVEDQIFIDVQKDHKNANAIKYLKENNVLNGYNDGTFRPDNPVNRAEFVKIVFEGLKIPINEYSYNDETRFVDVEQNSWYEKYVYNAKDKNIVKGYDGNLFKPTQNVTKAEAIKILYVAKNIDPTNSELIPSIIDVSQDDWFKDYIAHALNHGYIDAENSEANPNKSMTRAEIAELIYRIIKDNR